MRYGCRCGSAFGAWRVWAMLCLFAALCHAHGQSGVVPHSVPGVYEFERDRLPIASMDGMWRFQTGDDPDGSKGWASPGFDDSSWRLVGSGTSWVKDPSQAFGGPAWFRARIFVPAGPSNLMAYLPKIYLGYRLYADGHLIGGVGTVPPKKGASTPIPLVIPLPSSSSAHTVVLALRVWRWPQWNYFYKFGLPDGIRVGDARLLQEKLADEEKGTAWDWMSVIILLLIELLLGIATLVLFALRRSEYANLWFGTMLVLSAADRGWNIWGLAHPVSIAVYYEVLLGVSSLWRLAQILFYFYFLKGTRNWLFWSAIGAASLLFVATDPLFFPQYFPSWLGDRPIIFWSGLDSALQAAPSIWILTLLYQRARDGREDARVLLVPAVLKNLSPILGFVGYWGYYGFSWRPPILAWLDEITTTPFPISFYDLADGLFLVAMLAILLRRFVRTAAQEEDHQRERDAAHAVQLMLVPEETPSVPGFEVQSVYLPYGEVGGDFFQVIPSANSSVLVAIGDVSGKGLPAAMTVALLVGTFRTCAMYSRNPGEILALMNQALAGGGSGGFTTCLVLRADADGTLTVANAGHLSPYLNGEALEQECELPLGLVEHATYAHASYHLPVNSRLTLLTDGVLEAQSDTGELFGFERMAAATKESAAEIARSAKEFGQEDDITVLRLVRVA